MSNAGRKCRYENDVKPNLELVESWKRKGLSDKQIYDNLGIGKSVFYKYKKKYVEFADTLKKGKNNLICDLENALIKKALGYDIEDTKTYIEELGEGENKKVKKKIERLKKHIPPSEVALIFALTNLDNTNWRHKQTIEHSQQNPITIINDIPKIKTNDESK